MTRSGGPELPGGEVRPVRRPRQPEPRRASGSATSPRRAGWTIARVDRRREPARQVDRFRRISDKAAGDPVVALDEYYEQGYDLMSSPEAQTAFDISREDPTRVRDAYGRNSFGQRALLARRLVEAGVPFVTLNEGGWDHHIELFDRRSGSAARRSSSTHRRADRGPGPAGTAGDDPGDRPGRVRPDAARSTTDAGRDHWSNAMSVLFAGGGTPGGQVVGATDRQRLRAPCERILSPENFAATVYTKLGIDPGKILYAPQRPAHPPGQRPDADPRADGMSRPSGSVRGPARGLVGLGGAVLIAGLVGPGPSSAKPPTLSGLFPPGAGRGQTVAIEASGSFDHWPVRAWAEGRGVEIRAEKQKGKLTAVVDSDAAPGCAWIRLHDDKGASGLRPFFIGVLPEEQERFR